ncbi:MULTISPECIES: hypothetical protein [Okeania]|uniref:hypothetical protein n=1 Tax=Okeania TaxID=1458928 RepID=UPI001374D3A6|nr:MULTISPECIES: hypothetical protein [Okeania]NES75369.1 hypothetical protein [Okeania sp. SIO1H4]NET19092.1 hypothetical protein [Okeania sp. SIO1H5]NET78472.1 hypothetical protein [Okeania sp. SIO1F9]NET92865.1 hypothetical protein [Okeania sp. SIO1H2]
MVGSGAFDDFGKGMVSILATIHHYYSATRKSEVISCPVASVLYSKGRQQATVRKA